MSSSTCPLWKMKGFCYLYTLQVGIAIICACGITLMTVSLSVNVAYVARGDSNGTLGQCAVQFVLFNIFLTLGYVAYIFALTGAYKEEVMPLKIALYALLAQVLLWIILTVVSFLPIDDVLDWSCVQGLRCADRFFIHYAYYRKGQRAEDEYNWRTDENPRKVFKYKNDCLDYCHSEYDSTTAGQGTLTTQSATGTTTSANGTNTSDNGTTTSDNVTTASDNVTTTSDNVTTASDNVTTTSDNVTTTSANGTTTTANGTTYGTTPTIGPLDTTRDTVPVESSSRGGMCTCSRVKREIKTLIGTADSTSHLVAAIIFTIFIAVFWYFYAICTIGSYITFLKTPIPPKRSTIQRTSQPKSSVQK